MVFRKWGPGEGELSSETQPFSPNQLYARSAPPPLAPPPTLASPSRASVLSHSPLSPGAQRSPKVEKQAGKLLQKLQKNRQSILSGAGGSFGALHQATRFSTAFPFRLSALEDLTPYENSATSGALSDGGKCSSPGKGRGSKKKKKGKLRQAVSQICEMMGLKRMCLIALTVGYTFLGGGLFYFLEHQPEQDALAGKRLIHLERRENYTEKLLEIFANECQGGTFEEQYGLCQKFIARALLAYDQDSELWPVKEPLYKWDYWNACFYAVALYTTMGFGNMACKTFAGRLCTILYAFIGIPLMLTLLNDLGQWCQNVCDQGWLFLMGLRARLVRSCLRRRGSEESEEDTNPSVSSGFPLWLAILIVFFYVFFCASLFMLWEDKWTYFTAFYFFFVSLSTIGLGDVLPGNPHFMVASSVLFILGLALVSMVINVLQQRVEAKYLAALEMLEEAYMGGDESLSPDPRSPGAESVHSASMGIMQISRSRPSSISQAASFDEDRHPKHSPRKLTAISEGSSGEDQSRV